MHVKRPYCKATGLVFSVFNSMSDWDNPKYDGKPKNFLDLEMCNLNTSKFRGDSATLPFL
jgi:hypothetical protein